MNSFEKTALTMLMLVVVVSGLILSGCSYLKNKKTDTVSRQEKDSVATIEHQEASGESTHTEAAIEKDSLAREHILKF